MIFILDLSPSIFPNQTMFPGELVVCLSYSYSLLVDFSFFFWLVLFHSKSSRFDPSDLFLSFRDWNPFQAINNCKKLQANFEVNKFE